MSENKLLPDRISRIREAVADSAKRFNYCCESSELSYDELIALCDIALRSEAQPVAWMADIARDGLNDCTSSKHKADEWQKAGVKVTPLYEQPIAAGQPFGGDVDSDAGKNSNCPAAPTGETPKDLVSRLNAQCLAANAAMLKEHVSEKLCRRVIGGLYIVASEAARELAAAQREIKNLAPTGMFNGLDIYQWKERAESAEAALAELRGRYDLLVHYTTCPLQLAECNDCCKAVDIAEAAAQEKKDG